MILINEQWCEVKDLEDIATIIKEQFNYDLSDEMDELIKIKDEQIRELEDDAEYWANECRRGD